jgi:hypothetical protein
MPLSRFIGNCIYRLYAYLKVSAHTDCIPADFTANLTVLEDTISACVGSGQDESVKLLIQCVMHLSSAQTAFAPLLETTNVPHTLLWPICVCVKKALFQFHLLQPARFAHPSCRLALTLGFGIPRFAAGGDFVCFRHLVTIGQVFLARKSNSARPGILIFFTVISQSFVWAVLPFTFAKTLYPAIDEMHTASVLCEKELLCNRNHGAQQVAPAESCLQRIVSHVAAAGITAGRSSEVFGIVMPVFLFII